MIEGICHAVLCAKVGEGHILADLTEFGCALLDTRGM